MKIMTESIHFTADQKLLHLIERKLQKLERLYERIIDIKVVLKLENHQTIKDKIVEILIHVPGGNLFARESSRNFETAIELALASLKKQTMRFKGKIQSN
ncbi:MAG TPA: ribosome-associated translation inhibitor RaiA [Saprospiraceae bacterium]|nr:ribosome-associated translation inhibitor RaiA [Saprospiraceae bacterium]HNT20137.1 ribosome-associated translation inhibitor RaiA [Saprospiraceae bacterium]